MATVISLGWRDPTFKGNPRVIYCGSDVDEADKALQKAGKEKVIAAGQIFRGIEDRAIRRIVFDS
jgi:hypothetical protein